MMKKAFIPRVIRQRSDTQYYFSKPRVIKHWYSSISSTQSAKSEERKSSDIFDVLSNHGGKIAFVGFGVAASLIYSFYLGGVNRRALEDELYDSAALTPYDINELRDQNQVKDREFLQLCQEIINQYDQYHSGNSTLDRSLTYPSFIGLVKQRLTIKSAHLLDNWALAHLHSFNSKSIDIYQSLETQPIPLDLLLMLLSLSVESSQSCEKRAIMMAELNEKLKTCSVASSEPASATLPSSISLEDAIKIIQLLQLTFQVNLSNETVLLMNDMY